MKDIDETYRKFILTLVIVVPLRGYFIMLGFGVLHNDWSPVIPSLGFWACLILSLAFAGAVRR